MDIIISNNANKPIYEQITTQIKAMIMSGRDLLGVPVIDELRLCYLAEPSLLQELASIPKTVDVLLDLKFLAEYTIIYPTSVLLLSPRD